MVLRPDISSGRRDFKGLDGGLSSPSGNRRMQTKESIWCCTTIKSEVWEDEYIKNSSYRKQHNGWCFPKQIH